MVNDNDARMGVFPILDSQWHMLTLTSQPGNAKGYVMYLDGVQVAGINSTVPIMASNGQPLHVDGGDPMNLTGNIILCSRSDDPSERHFDGYLAYLSMWDSALNAQQVSALNSTVAQKAGQVATDPLPTGPVTEAPALSTRQPETSAVQYSRSGRPCMFPALYNGEMVTDCVDIAGTGYCQVGQDSWEACAIQEQAGAIGTAPFVTAQQPPLGAPMDEIAPEYADYGDVTPSEAALGVSPSGEMGNTTRGSLYSADGQMCQLPLQYSGMQVENCVGIGGDFFCWGEGSMTWAPCAEDALTTAPDPGDLGVGADAVPIINLKQRSRRTTDGETCVLPTVVDGQILDDCVQQNGQLSCLTPAGAWKACDLRYGDVQIGDEGALMVADRNSTDGLGCIFPAVYK